MYEKIKNKIIGNVGLGNEKNRDKWLEKVINDIPNQSKILDAGAGELKYEKFCSHLDYTSQDFGKYTVEGNDEGKQTVNWDNSKIDIVSDIIDIPLPDKSFDAIMCVEVFEHIAEPVKAVKQFERILKPGGVLILTAPFCSITHFAPYYFANGYSKYWYEKILKDYNFIIDELVYNGNYFEYIAQEIHHLPRVEDRYSASHLVRSFFGKITRFLMLAILNRASKQNSKSEELLCFGLQVLAHKKIKHDPVVKF